MPRRIRSVVVFVLLGATTGVAQLPPEMTVDRYLLRAEELLAEKDHEAALDLMEKIQALQREHGLTLPDGFHFQYAQVAFASGAISAARDSLNQYLVEAGRTGEFYRAALKLLNLVEQIQTKYPDQVDQLMAEKDYAGALELMDRIQALQREHGFTLPDGFRDKYAQARVARLAEESCEGKSKGDSCWMELANQPECYVWNPDYWHYRGVAWTAECAEGLAQGTGTLKWMWDFDARPKRETLEPEGKEVSTDSAGTPGTLQLRAGSPPLFGSESTCTGQPEGAACWMELANQPECYVWNDHLERDETATWTAECAEGLAQGTGTLKWAWKDDYYDSEKGKVIKDGIVTLESTGTLQDGKHHDDWAERYVSGGTHWVRIGRVVCERQETRHLGRTHT